MRKSRSCTEPSSTPEVAGGRSSRCVPVEDAPWQALDLPQRRYQTLNAVHGLLLWESRGKPLLIAVENLHWIDAETQVLLDSLVTSLPSARMLLLVNYRPEYQHTWGSKIYYRSTVCGI